MRFGSQLDIAGIIAPSADADRSIRYLTKYLTKSVTETYTDPDGAPLDPAYEAHIDRLHEQLLVPACAPECLQLAALRDPTQGRRSRPVPGCACQRHTTGRTSASAAAASKSPAPGQARP